MKGGDVVKKMISIILWLSFVLCLTACSYNNQPDNTSANSDSDKITKQEMNLPLLHREYAVIIDNIIKAHPWNDDDLTMVPENPELSYMYRRNSELSEIGFALIDLDGNGQEELIISDPSKFVYDLYTVSNGKAVHLFDSGERHYYILRENGVVENSWLGSSATSGHDFYKLNDGKLELVERITLDAYHALDAGLINDLSEANDDNCFFRSNSENEKDYIAVSFDEAIKAIENYQNANESLMIEYTLLSEYKQ